VEKGDQELAVVAESERTKFVTKKSDESVCKIRGSFLAQPFVTRIDCCALLTASSKHETACPDLEAERSTENMKSSRRLDRPFTKIRMTGPIESENEVFEKSPNSEAIRNGEIGPVEIW
jgi:hypothetical protein